MKKQLLLVLAFGICAFSILPAQSSVKELLKQAQADYDEGNLEAAFKACEKVLFEDSENVDAYVLRGSIYAFFNMQREALNDLNYAIRQGTKNAEAYMSRGYVYQTDGNEAMAEKDFSMAISLDKKSEAPYRMRGRLRIQEGHIEQGFEDLDKAVKLEPTKPLAYYTKGYSYFELGDYARAIENLNRAMELKYNHPKRIYNYLGHCARAMNKPEAALGYYQKALEEDSAYATAWVSIGKLKYDTLDYEGALADMERALLIDSLHIDAHSNKAYCLFRLDRIMEAMAILDESISRRRFNVNDYGTRGACKMKLGQFEGAIMDYSKLLLRSEEPEAYLQRSRAYAATGQYDKALRDAGKAVEMLPDDFEAGINQAICLFHAGRFEELLTKSIALVQNFPDAGLGYYYLAIAEERLDQKEKALVHYTQSLQKGIPDSVNAYLIRGNCKKSMGMTEGYERDLDSAFAIPLRSREGCVSKGYFLNEAGRYAQSLALNDSLIAIDSSFAYSFNNRGFAKYKLGQYEAAIKDFNKSIALKNDYYHWPPRNRGLAKMALGRYQEAVDDFTLSLSYVPDYVEALNDRGEAWEKLGEKEKAITDYEAALKVKPDFEAAQRNLERLKQ
jgi:tetratricopeptide (TPR) repeat protein